MADFKKIQHSVSHFKHPIWIVFFCHLSIKNPSALKNLVNESKLMSELLKLFTQTITETIDKIGINNSCTISKEIVRLVCQASVKCVNLNEYELNQEKYDNMKSEIEEKYTGLAIDSCLSCLLVEERSFYFADDVKYIYPHILFQEYYASKAILDILEQKTNPKIGNNKPNLKNVISSLVDKSAQINIEK